MIHTYDIKSTLESVRSDDNIIFTNVVSNKNSDFQFYVLYFAGHTLPPPKIEKNMIF
jgi:hypothetical protein